MPRQYKEGEGRQGHARKCGGLVLRKDGKFLKEAENEES
jgi:hypothetical protein